MQQLFIVAVATETDVHSEEFLTEAEARERFNSLKESGFMVNLATVTLPPAEALQHALKLAFIKLVQVGGFNSLDGVNTPDPQAHKQILDAIHTFDPAFQFTEADWNTPARTESAALMALLQVMAQAEVEHLKAKGWTQQDFANALKRLLGENAPTPAADWAGCCRASQRIWRLFNAMRKGTPADLMLAPTATTAEMIASELGITVPGE